MAGGACAAVADLNRGFYCCSLFPPPSLLLCLSLSLSVSLSLSLSLSLSFFSTLAEAVLEERKKGRQRIAYIS